MSEFKKTIYRRCACGETAHDARYEISTRTYTWGCRNCGELARRDGRVRIIGRDDLVSPRARS